MSATVPTIVLGGTGYVAGELLRLIAGHPNLKLAGILSDSQPGEPVAKAFGHLASAYPDTKFSSIEEIEKLVATLPASADLLGCAAWRIGCADRPAADRGRARRHEAARGGYLRGLPLLHRRGLCGRVQARARRAAAPVAVHLRGAGASGRVAHAACRAPGWLTES